MAGLEKIKEQILAQAKEEADEILGRAKEQADALLKKNEEETAALVAEIEKKSESDVISGRARVQSSNDLYRRTESLKSKQAVIQSVVEKAYRKVCALEVEPYFALIERMAVKYALPQDGEIIFSAADKKRMPGGFEDKLKAAAKAAGGSLRLSKEERAIENGFVLVYGGVEENCTIKALFDAQRDQIQDTVYGILYGDA